MFGKNKIGKIIKGRKKEEKLIAGKFTEKELNEAVKSFYKTTYPAMKKLSKE